MARMPLDEPAEAKLRELMVELLALLELPEGFVGSMRTRVGYELWAGERGAGSVPDGYYNAWELVVEELARLAGELTDDEMTVCRADSDLAASDKVAAQVVVALCPKAGVPVDSNGVLRELVPDAVLFRYDWPEVLEPAPVELVAKRRETAAAYRRWQHNVGGGQRVLDAWVRKMFPDGAGWDDEVLRAKLAEQRVLVNVALQGASGQARLDATALLEDADSGDQPLVTVLALVGAASVVLGLMPRP